MGGHGSEMAARQFLFQTRNLKTDKICEYVVFMKKASLIAAVWTLQHLEEIMEVICSIFPKASYKH